MIDWSDVDYEWTEEKIEEFDAMIRSIQNHSREWANMKGHDLINYELSFEKNCGVYENSNFYFNLDPHTSNEYSRPSYWTMPVNFLLKKNAYIKQNEIDKAEKKKAEEIKKKEQERLRIEKEAKDNEAEIVLLKRLLEKHKDALSQDS